MLVGNETLLNTAELLVQSLRNEDEEQARQALRELDRLQDDGLYQEIGRLTRELHESINEALTDERLVEIASVEIPDARGRLSHVISMTEDSANRTLTAVETGMPLSESIAASASELAEAWERFTQREMELAEFRELAKRLGGSLQQIQLDSVEINNKMSEVLMAQDFQDLTGQIIRRVITLVSDVEQKLVHLIKITGQQPVPEEEKKNEEDASKGHGPAVPGLDTGVVSSQDDVDDLLSSLGF